MCRHGRSSLLESGIAVARSLHRQLGGSRPEAATPPLGGLERLALELGWRVQRARADQRLVIDDDPCVTSPPSVSTWA